MTADKGGLVSFDELSSILRAHAGPRRPMPQRPRGWARRRPRIRWIAAAATAALFLGSGLGFGLGSWATPSGSAGRKLEGVGLLPSRGWTVVQWRAKDSSGASSLVASNVPIRAADDLTALSPETLAWLPVRGIVVVATFTPRGDPAVDLKFPVRELPLRLADARRGLPLGDFSRVSVYRLPAAVGGYNIDASIYFGSPRPTEPQLRSAQRQLGRLLVGAAPITLFARTTVVTSSTTLYGAVEGGRAGESVTIQVKDCGQQDFNAVAGTTTTQGGGWSYVYYPFINTTVRAVWNGQASEQLTLRQRAVVELARLKRPGAFGVAVKAKKSFWRKRVQIQRRNAGEGWTAVKSVTLTDAYSPPGSTISVAGGDFNLSVPKGTLLRAVVPLSQARPCYLSGTSRVLRR